MAATGMFAALLLFCIVKHVVTGSSFPGSKNRGEVECNICDFQLNTEFAKQGAVNSFFSSSRSTENKINPTVALPETKSARDSVECHICDYIAISQYHGGRTTSFSSESASEEKMASATTSSGHQCAVAEAEQKEPILPGETPEERQQDSSKSEDTPNSTATCHFLDYIVLPSHADFLKTAFIGGLTIRTESLSISA